MKKHSRITNFETAQVIPLVVLSLFVIIGFVALILDGGSLMSNRRTAQAAADAGALAGAKRLCSGESDVASVASNFATINGAPNPSVSVDFTNRLVTVNTVVENPSFFAKIFGEDNLEAGAQAIAGCFYPSNAKRVLPIAFFYESPPVKANVADCSDVTKPCGLVNWDFDTLMTQLSTTPAKDQPLDNIYVIAESTKICEKRVSGEILCTEMKFNASGGNRSWIDLNKANIKNKNLKDVIRTGVDWPIYTPAWFNGQTGVNAAVFDAKNFDQLEKIEGYTEVPVRMAYVPVFDLFCLDDPANNCSTDSEDRFEYLVNPNQQAYRLVGFAPFVITCTTKNTTCQSTNSFGICVPANTTENPTNKDVCPGYMATNPSNQDKDAIEGYFVDGVIVDAFAYGTGGVDVGLSLISLIK